MGVGCDIAALNNRVVTRYMGSRINGSFRGGIGGIRYHNPGIWDHNPWDRDQHVFVESGIKILNVFEIRDQNFGQKYGISNEKIYLVTTL